MTSQSLTCGVIFRLTKLRTILVTKTCAPFKMSGLIMGMCLGCDGIIIERSFTSAASSISASPSLRKTRQTGPVTCPGFAGYCSESYPGDTCLVVCAFGRNNVPECQNDGTWTDIPRCIEHEPGIPEQVPGICPGIPGYCSLANSGEVCEFDCVTGKDIRSFCTPDGTWEPYPTCDGDVRETRDGCNPCPGPFGGARNRKLETQTNTGISRANIDPIPFRAPPQPSRPARPVPRPASQPARPTFNRNSSNRNQGRGEVTVIQPARETPFSPAPQPAFLVNSNSNRETVRKFPGNVAPSNKVSPSNSQRGRKNNGSRRNNNFGQKVSNNSFRNQQRQSGQSNRSRSQPTPSFRPPQTPVARLSTSSSKTVSLGSSRCPGDSLEVCIDVCPSFSARIFGACVAGCARRCPTKK